MQRIPGTEVVSKPYFLITGTLNHMTDLKTNDQTVIMVK